MTMLSGYSGWVHKEVLEDKTHTWVRGGRFYVAHNRKHKWYNEWSKKWTTTQETLEGRIFEFDRSKYLPDGSSNPNWVGNYK